MNANTTKIIAVAVVIVIAVGGVLGFVLLDKGNNNGRQITVDAALEVYGNADNDYKIDSNDLDIVKKVMNNEDGYTLEKYPLADANHNGTVDQADVDIVDKIVKKEKTSVWIVNHTTDTTTYPGGIYVSETHWPITKCIANGAANALLIYELVGLKENIVGINYAPSSPPDGVIYEDYANMISLGPSTNDITASLLDDCLEKNPGTTAVITADNKGYLAGDKGLSEAELRASPYNLDVIRIQHAAVDEDKYASALLLLGFLFQKQTRAEDVAQWIADVYSEIDKSIANVEKKVRVNASSYYTYLSNRNSDYADVVVKAGGEYVLGTGSKASTYFSGGSADPSIYNADKQSDVIICIRTGTGFLKASWYDSPEKFDVKNMKTQLAYFEGFDAYQNSKVWHISGDMPVVARVLYSAAILYPDLITIQYADEKHQEFVDNFLGGSYTVKDLKFVLSQSEILAMGGSS